MGEYEDAVQVLKDQGFDDLASTFEKFTASSLRKQAERAGELERELEQTRKELTNTKAVPKREEAFRNAGVDFDSLRPAELAAIKSLEHEGEAPSTEAVSRLIEELKLPIKESTQEEEEEKPEAARVADQARTAQERKLGGSTVIKAIDATEWPADKLRRFLDEHPNEYETLLRGEDVVGVAFS